MNIYKEFVVEKEKTEEVFKLLGDVVYFNKCHYFISSIDCTEGKIYKQFMTVRVHFSPYEFNANTEVKEFPQLKESVINV